MELLTRQSRWHQESDNALAELQRRIEKLERGKDAA
jgi:hypothetical protein